MRNSDIELLADFINKRTRNERFVMVPVKEADNPEPLKFDVVVLEGERYLQVPKSLYNEHRIERSVGSMIWATLAAGYKEFKNLDAKRIIPEPPWQECLKEVRLENSREFAHQLGINVPTIGGE